MANITKYWKNILNINILNIIKTLGAFGSFLLFIFILNIGDAHQVAAYNIAPNYKLEGKKRKTKVGIESTSPTR